MIRYALCLLLIGSVIAGCSGPSDVTTSDVKAKEKQIDDATKALNSGHATPPDPQNDRDHS